MKVEFTKAFACYKKGDTAELSSMLSARLINRQVAKVYKPKKK